MADDLMGDQITKSVTDSDDDDTSHRSSPPVATASYHDRLVRQIPPMCRTSSEPSLRGSCPGPADVRSVDLKRRCPKNSWVTCQ